MLIDVFPYAYGPEVLLLRMQELANFVGMHVIVECDRTFTGEPRPFAWPKLAELPEFQPFLSKVQWCPITIPEGPIATPEGLHTAWVREEYVRSSCLLQARAFSRSRGDYILFGDHDEIPNPSALVRVLAEGVKRARLWGAYHEWFLNMRAAGSPGYLWEFRQPIMFQANDPLVHCWGVDSGAELRALQWQGCDDVMELGRHTPAERGWHMTLQGGAEQVWRKLQIGAHTELQPITLEDVQALMDKRVDILNRCHLERVPDAELPTSLLANRQHYEGMILQ